MTTTAFNRCFTTFFVHLFMAILAQFMCCLLVAIDIRIAYLPSMATGTFVNHHYLILGMMAGSTGI